MAATDEEAATLALLAEGADVLTESEAVEALNGMITKTEMLIQNWHEAAGALAAVTRVVPAASQTLAATAVRDLVTSRHHAGLIQALARTVESIRWRDVNEGERDHWFDLIERDFKSGSDVHFVALRAVVALGSVAPERIDAFLARSFEQEPTLEVLAVTMDALEKLPSWAQKDAWDLVSHALRSIREEAARGSWSMGLIDVGTLAVAVLEQQPGNSHRWAELTDFIVDPVVGVGSKTRILDVLARPEINVPRKTQDRLRAALPTLKAAEVDSFTSSLQAWEGAILRFGARIRAFGMEEVLARLLRLAGQPDGLSRIQAALTLPYARRDLGFGVATTLALQLAQDPHQDVRAASARVLSQLEIPDKEGPLEATRRQQLAALLMEPGTVVPHAAIVGLSERTHPKTLDPEFKRLIEQITFNHASYAVRASAEVLLHSSGNKPTPAESPRRRPGPRPLPKTSASAPSARRRPSK
jgi:hypothetical protein